MLRRQFLLQSGAAALLAGADIDVSRQGWTASWIYPASADPRDYGVYHFRRAFTLDSKPEHCWVHVTADSRYHLYVNGEKVSSGPARGDLTHWRYETADLAPHLRGGRNAVTAIVWNDGPYAAVAQWSDRTAFLLQAVDEAHGKLMNTGPGWKSLASRAYQAVPVPNYQPTGYYAIGPCEKFDASQYAWGWQAPDFDDAGWAAAEPGRRASSRDQRDAPTRWMLVPRPIPPMEETPVRLARVRRAENAQVGAGFPAQAAAVRIPANTKATLLLDQGHLTTAFPVVRFHGGKDASLSLAYAEALFAELRPRRRKGNRDQVEGKTFLGYADMVVADGASREWRPLFWRCFRYIQLTVETRGEDLVIDDLHAVYTGYPFQVEAKFESADPLHARILEVGWRTARLCAHETYMDCPYYEQLQYIGDTRIQCLVSLFMTGDARLMRNAIELLDDSRTPEGATYSRAPSVLQQYIPPFCLWWIGMVHDYWWYVDDPAFVKRMLPGVRAVLSFYESYLRPDSLLGPMPWWNYVDWVEQWPNGRPPSEPGVMPAAIHLQYLLALQWASELERSLGLPVLAGRYTGMADRLKQKVQPTFWSADRRLFSEDLAHQHFSQHANVLAVLAGAVGAPAEERDLMERVEPDKSLYKCSVYFRYYLDRAMVKAGLGDRYLTRLGTWKFMLDEGLTTWAEQDSPYTRSDCHAWSASPNIEFFRTVLGVDSAAPGFRKVTVRPHLGPLERASGVVPHPRGPIRVEARRTPTGVEVDVKVPPGVEYLPER
jgi:alpha-L-rhamnosidase